MLNSFIIVLREGFESFLLVAVILTYLRKSGQKWLTSAVYVAIVLALSVSAALGYLLKNGVEDLFWLGSSDKHWVDMPVSFSAMKPCVKQCLASSRS